MIFKITAVFLVFIKLCLSIKVSVYYEAMCIDSARFIALQLYPHIEELNKYIKLDLIPYGKASHSLSDGQFEFFCQHGYNECKGNKYYSCALAQSKGDQKQSVNFINCVMRQRALSSYSTFEKCAKIHNIDTTKLKSCSQSDEGDILLAAHGDATNNLNPSISFVPTIIFNDKYDDKTQKQSLKDFAAVVCSKINGTQPELCKNRKLPTVSYDDFYY